MNLSHPMTIALRNAAAALALAVMATSCGTNPESTGVEYAPQMYHSIPYEPYTQVTDSTSEFFNTLPRYVNGKKVYKNNFLLPVKGTIKRKQYLDQAKNELAQDIMQYDIHPDSLEHSAEFLKSPLQPTEAVLAHGKTLYNSYCSACHGENGDGAGKVAELYKGVPGYKTGRYATLTEGHIFHTITHGKGRMWPHGSQLNPDERWKVVAYVQTLQKSAE